MNNLEITSMKLRASQVMSYYKAFIANIFTIQSIQLFEHQLPKPKISAGSVVDAGMTYFAQAPEAFQKTSN